MVVEKTKASGELVTALFQAFEHGSNSISAVPGLLKQVIKEDAWREYTLPNSSVVRKYTNFAEFTEKVLRATIEDLKNLCQKDKEALVLLREVTTNPNHRPVTNDNVITSKSEQGNSKAYSLDKLKRDRPDLFEKVVNNELSANKAMVEAGFRRKQITIIIDPARTAKAIKTHFNHDQRKEIVRLLSDD